MTNSVCEHVLARQPKSHSPEIQISALWLVSATVLDGVTGLALAWTVVTVVIVLVVAVPSTWPGSAGCRRFGLDLPGRLLH
jgi:hypothetical protein